jgi:hypothetical protein
MKRIAVLLLAVSLGACSPVADLLLRPDAGERPRLEFTWADAGTTSRTPSVTAEGGAGRLSVSGVLDSGWACAKLSGRVRPDGGVVELRVRVETNGAQVCVGVVGYFSYAAAVEPLPPGTHRVRVVYEYVSIVDGSIRESTALTEDVTVQ